MPSSDRAVPARRRICRPLYPYQVRNNGFLWHPSSGLWELWETLEGKGGGSVFQGLWETGEGEGRRFPQPGSFHNPRAVALEFHQNSLWSGKAGSALKPRACPEDRPPALFAKAVEYPRPKSLRPQGWPARVQGQGTRRQNNRRENV